MPKRVLQRLVAAMAATILARAAVAGALAPIALDSQALSAGHIRTTELKRLQSAPQVTAYGVVLDPGALVTLSSQVAAARGAAAAARAKAALARSQARRATGLYRIHHNISKAALQIAQSGFEVAQAGQATAAARLVQLKTRMLAHWGPKLSAAARSGKAPLPGLESGASALVEVNLPLGQALAHPPEIASATTPEGQKVLLHLLSRAPRTAAGVAGQSVFYLMPERNSIPIGTPLSVVLETAARGAGVLVPQSAVVWHEGKPLAFRETVAGSFAGVPLGSFFVSSDGYFVPERGESSLHPGDRVVTAGAALLYSAATQAAPAAKTAKSGKADDDGDD